jgi:hypothetical protein
MFKSAKSLMVSLFGIFILTTSAIAQEADQAVDQQEATAAPVPLTQNAPRAESDQAAASEQSSEQSLEAKLGQGTKAQAEHSAQATAHKSVNDPNNQLGTSLQGRTRPIVEANGAQTNPAPAVTPAQGKAE